MVWTHCWGGGGGKFSLGLGLFWLIALELGLARLLACGASVVDVDGLPIFKSCLRTTVDWAAWLLCWGRWSIWNAGCGGGCKCIVLGIPLDDGGVCVFCTLWLLLCAPILLFQEEGCTFVWRVGGWDNRRPKERLIIDHGGRLLHLENKNIISS